MCCVEIFTYRLNLIWYADIFQSGYRWLRSRLVYLSVGLSVCLRECIYGQIVIFWWQYLFYNLVAEKMMSLYNCKIALYHVSLRYSFLMITSNFESLFSFLHFFGFLRATEMCFYSKLAYQYQFWEENIHLNIVHLEAEILL